MIKIITGCLILLLCGCSTTPQGIISPDPKGCIGVEFFSHSNTSKVRRNEAGEVKHVITPTDRVEPLLKKWNLTDFEDAIREKEKIDSDVREHSAPDGSIIYLPKEFSDPHIPGIEAWSEVKKHLNPDDEIWTFGMLDCGTVIIRNNQLFCMIWVTHNW